ncbi:MAG: CHASE2 domain-containing protein [Candidatus Marinimicrobia bacterium]|jgi:class 3 adenylate cyclase|nr:CHASE2 domain-containing protein [Candidatus Neomarinimicrobiota bacterium]MBT4733996.1 CHASE2 domain-containing protein [Candidatus Neomarinimicrobiota bacterium]MBT5069303.1 CHASE2 domain-containing protein [Candidatus Neomarinimicrobiota bacterium]MBT6113197.1 CHASE2 domain-containing protein [Candidatus Neomarinimicrobiota bacterium]MBT6471841.1 CHASE2 domain-containing protein [Candidatus Neomarinimicrobiota bacterium]
MNKQFPYLIIAFSISGLIAFASLFGVYDTIENKLLDMRFNQRGRIETRNDIATLDIDVRALQTIGKWDPWSREKHLPMVKAAGQHGMDLLAFDIYFIENSERKLNYKALNAIADSVLSMDQVKNLFPNPDSDLANASEIAGNVTFAQSFKPQPKKKERVKDRTDVQTTRLNLMDSLNLFRKVNREDYATIFDFYDGEFPVEIFIQKSAGIYFFQAKADADGVMRKYPLIGLYEDRLFPSVSLAMALKHYHVSFDSVEIIPGTHLKFNIPEQDEYGQNEIVIPINDEGMMQVNWAGNWEDADGNFDVMHYPYNVLKDFQETEYPNYIMAEYKRIANTDFGGDIKAALKPVVGKLPNKDRKLIITIAKKLIPMGMAESYIRKYPDKTAQDFKRLPPFMYNELKNNNLIADSFHKSGETNLNDMLVEGSLIYDPNLENYTISSLSSLQADLKDAIDKTDDISHKKAHKKAQAKLALLERNFQIISNLNNNNMIDEQRPLYFMGNSQRLISGKEEKGNARLIVPFEFVGKKLFYGLTATGTHDLNPMPFNPRYPMVGLHANALNTILSGNFINKSSKVLDIAIILFVGLILAIAVPKLSATQGGILMGTQAIGHTFIAFYLFSNYNYWLDLFGPGITMVVGYLGITIYNYIQEEKNKQFLKESFGTYVSPELIDQMYDSGEEPSLGGEEGYHTAFFTDIQSFSAFSEKLTASELVALLNQYLTDMTDVLLENKGTLDKYIGDAIVAFYGAPIEIDDHEMWACITAIKMQESLELLRQGWQEEGDRWPEIVHHMQNRIGISSGQMVTGNMGSASRMNYTMMGDNVNTAARLESSAKQYGIYIQIADSTYQAVKDRVVVRDLDLVKVMGKNEPVKVWELICEVGQEPEQYKKILPAYHEALDLYKSQQWEKAIEAFKVSDALEDMFPGRKTNPSRIYIPRCEYFIENPPGRDWDGVWTLTSK